FRSLNFDYCYVMKKRLFSGKCITYFSIVVVILFSMFFFKTSPTENSMLAPHDIVTRGDIIKETFVTGILKPSKTILIGTQVNGQLKKIYRSEEHTSELQSRFD